MHCYGDSRFIHHEENREPGLADKLRCTGILARSGMLAVDLGAALWNAPAVVHGGRPGKLAVVSIGGNDIERCGNSECVRRAEASIDRVVARLSRGYDRVAILGPPGDYRHKRLPLSAGGAASRLEEIVEPYPGVDVLRIDHIPVGYTSDGVHFDDATNTRVAATILAARTSGEGGSDPARSYIILGECTNAQGTPRGARRAGRSGARGSESARRGGYGTHAQRRVAAGDRM
jgi:hypothetical protein